MDWESIASILTCPLRWVWDFVMENRVLRGALAFALLAAGSYSLLYWFMTAAGFERHIQFVSANFAVWMMISAYVFVVLPWASPKFKRWIKSPRGKRAMALVLFILLIADAVFWYGASLGLL